MPPGPQRESYRLPRRGYGWHGIHERAGLIDEVYAAGYLYKCRNYHLIGRGRLLKRKGSQIYIATVVVDGQPIQSLHMSEFGSTANLLALCNGKLKFYNGTDWTDATGSLTFASGADNKMRVTQIRQGTDLYVVGTAPGSNRPWKWNGSGAATTLTDATTKGPQWAVDIVQFQGRLWALNTSNGQTLLEFSDDGMATDWSSGQYMHCTRETPGVGLIAHGQKALLVFHQNSIHRITYDYTTTEPWVQQPLTENLGAVSTYSLVHSKGVSYFAATDGFYRIRSPNSAPEYIGYPIEESWGGLNASRLSYIEGFERGEPWNEVVWLASKAGSSTHNIAFIWNTELEDWTIFDSPYSNFSFNCGTNFKHSTGKQVTLLGGYTGYVNSAWGDDNYDTGNLDGGATGAVIDSEIQTGMLDFGYEGIKRLKEIWVDAVILTTRNFTMEIVGLSEGTIVQDSTSVGTSGNRLSIDFYLDTSRLAASNAPTQARLIAKARSRMFQFRLTEQDTGDPHTVNALTFKWLPRGRRFNT